MYYYGFDMTYLYLVLPAMILAMYAQHKVKTTFAKYSKVNGYSGYTGSQIAEAILRDAGIYDVKVEHINGQLTDHYDPRAKVLRLSDSVYNSKSVAAIGVAAHEVGHAIQHDKKYVFLNLRNAIVPAVNFSSKLAMPLIFIGFLLSAMSRNSSSGILIIQIGIVLFAAVVAFQVITLPVEFNASNRAIKILSERNYLGDTETQQARKVLNAAALTYVASAAVALAQLLRFIILLNGRRDD